MSHGRDPTRCFQRRFSYEDILLDFVVILSLVVSIPENTRVWVDAMAIFLPNDKGCHLLKAPKYSEATPAEFLGVQMPKPRALCPELLEH